MKTLTMKGQINSSHIPIGLIVIALAVLISMSLPIKADINSADRYLPNPVKKHVADYDVANYKSIFSEITVINISELGSMRGGFRVGGLDINIGSIVKTFIDGRLALQSQLTLADNGSFKNSITTSVPSGIPGATVISRGGNGPSLQEVTPNGVQLNGLEGGEGVVVNDSRGFTAALQNVGKDRFLTTIVNRSSGRILQHKVDVDVTIRNFTQLQRNARIAGLAQRLTHRR